MIIQFVGSFWINQNESGVMATVHSPRRTRNQTTAEVAEAATADAEILRTILQELGHSERDRELIVN